MFEDIIENKEERKKTEKRNVNLMPKQSNISKKKMKTAIDIRKNLREVFEERKKDKEV